MPAVTVTSDCTLSDTNSNEYAFGTAATATADSPARWPLTPYTIRHGAVGGTGPPFAVLAASA